MSKCCELSKLLEEYNAYKKEAAELEAKIKPLTDRRNDLLRWVTTTYQKILDIVNA